MGRQIKTGLDYFPFDVAFFTELKVRKLIKYQGGRSISIYACLLCNIYENGYYMLWDNEIPFLVSEKTGFEEGYIKEVINCCLSVGLFDKNLYDNCKVITSKGIQKRYNEICKISKRKNQINEFSLINSEETIIYSEEIGINSEEIHINSGKSAQSKVKERKVKESKVNTPIIPKGDQQENLFPEEKRDNESEQVKSVSEEKEKSCAKKEKANQPDLDSFLAVAKEIYQNELKVDFTPYSFAVTAKYNSWVEAGWKDGHKKPIEGWKNKLRNVIPYLKPFNQNLQNGSSQARRR